MHSEAHGETPDAWYAAHAVGTLMHGVGRMLRCSHHDAWCATHAVARCCVPVATVPASGCARAARVQEAGSINLGFAPEGMHGGALLAVRAPEHVSFYDWESRACVRRIDVAAETVYWNPGGDMLAIVAKDSFYVLKYHHDAVADALAAGEPLDEDGVEDAFEVVTEVRVAARSWPRRAQHARHAACALGAARAYGVASAPRAASASGMVSAATAWFSAHAARREAAGCVQIEDRVATGLWVGDCFIFSNASWRLNYCVGGEVTVMFHLDRALYLLGYIAAQQRVYLLDREYSIVSYTLLLALVEFKTLVMRGAMDDAYAMLDSLPEDQLDGCAPHTARARREHDTHCPRSTDVRHTVPASAESAAARIQWLPAHSIARASSSHRARGSRSACTQLSARCGSVWRAPIRVLLRPCAAAAWDPTRAPALSRYSL
jgi:Coatomer WD associated region